MEHTVIFDISTMPLVLYADYGFCHRSMLHVDRTADFEVLILVLSGCIPVVEDGKEYFINSGDVFFLKSGVHHWGQTPIKEGTSWFFIHFSHDLPKDILPELLPGSGCIKNVHCRKEDYRRAITLPKYLSNVCSTQIEDKFRKVVELFHSDAPYHTVYVNSCLHELLADLYVWEHTDKNPDSTTIRIERISGFLAENVECPFSSAKIEEYMHLSFKYIGKLFKEHTGMTLHEYHTKLKIEQAARLLCTTDLPVSEISGRLGYSNPLYFSNVMKKHTGFSPRAYRSRYSSGL